MRVPSEVRTEIRQRLWEAADTLGWHTLTWVEKSPLYEGWTKDVSIGGVLSRYMDQRQVRVYIKDTLMKGYVRNRQNDLEHILRIVGLDSKPVVTELYQRPHGVCLDASLLLCWGSADEWKLILTAIHERGYEMPGSRLCAVVLLNALGRFHQLDTRAMVEDAAKKLLIERVCWVEEERPE